MMIQFELPPEIEARLRQDSSDLNQAAKQAALVELYRQGQITHYELGMALGLSRFEVDGVLKAHNVTEDLLSPEEGAAQFELLRELTRE